MPNYEHLLESASQGHNQPQQMPMHAQEQGRGIHIVEETFALTPDIPLAGHRHHCHLTNVIPMVATDKMPCGMVLKTRSHEFLVRSRSIALVKVKPEATETCKMQPELMYRCGCAVLL